jgi:hypothetical protein
MSYHAYNFLIPLVQDGSREPHSSETWDWLHARLVDLAGGYTRDAKPCVGCWSDNGDLCEDDSYRYSISIESRLLSDLRSILSECCTHFDQRCMFLAGGPRNETWLVDQSHSEPTSSLQEWVMAQLAAIEETDNRKPGRREADIVVELKDRAIDARMLTFALSLPEVQSKTPRDCKIQLLRCLRELGVGVG